MKVSVLNGSPKGEVSVTVQYIKFIQKKIPQHEFDIINISHDIARIEKNNEYFHKIIDRIKKADAVMWAVPLYVFLVPSQCKRFIEMIWENNVQEAFKDKYACTLTTSIHFFDHTANNYMRGICEDLGMKFTEYFSADMDDLFIEERRSSLLKWAAEFLSAAEFNTPTMRLNSPVKQSNFIYRPGRPASSIKTGGVSIKVLADIEDEKSNIARMVARFAGAFKQNIDVTNIREIDIKGGCLGCLECAFDNRCVYGDKDGFMKFFNEEMRDPDVVIFAGAIRDRFLSSRIKMFWDRSFFNGHIPWYSGKQLGFIISGPLMQIPNLQEIIQAIAEMMDANYMGVVTDESKDSNQIDLLLDAFAGKCVEYVQHKYFRPKTFLGVGGHKIFRDQIWSRLRFPFDADFKFYESHGLFDFPQNDTRYLEFSRRMIDLIRDPIMRERIRKMIKAEMIKGYADIVAKK